MSSKVHVPELMSTIKYRKKINVCRPHQCLVPLFSSEIERLMRVICPLQPSVLATQTIILILPANLVTRNIKQCPDDHLPLTRGLSTPSLDIILKQLMNLCRVWILWEFRNYSQSLKLENVNATLKLLRSRILTVFKIDKLSRVAMSKDFDF